MGIVKKKYTKSLPDQRRCTLKSCRKHFTPLRDGQFVCSYECSVKYSKELKDKAEKKQQRDWNVQKRERNDDLKTHSKWSAELDKLCQEIARLLDNGCDCISCQKPPKKKNGGHRFSKAAEPQLRHNLLIIWLQCEHCNSPEYRNGNPDGYDKGLEMYFGIDFKNEVHALREKYRSNKKTIPELIHAKARAKKIVKGLKELNATFTPEQRIELRRKYNKILQIYL